MKKRLTNYTKKVGLPPESLVYTGNRKPSPGEIEILIYDREKCDRIHTDSSSDLVRVINKDKINLLFINNLTDITLIEGIGKFFNIPPMILEDVLNTSHMPKAEETGDHLVLTMKFLDYPENGELNPQHVSLILGEYYVIVFKDFEKEIFHDLKNRIINGKSRARQRKAEYLFYLLIDTLVDTYYNIVDVINIKIDKLEEQLLEDPRPNYIQEIYLIKKTMGGMRGVIYPVREAILNMVQGDYEMLEDSTINYLQDVKDHINHIIHMYETGRDTLSDLIDLNSSNISNKLNSSMNILTIITTLFIPLTLIAGIYGMNFKFMPELGWKAGYPFAGLLMLITAAIMVAIMKRKKLL
jgi:magnesium transporter